MFRIYEIKIVLLDPLFYAREGFSGAYTPPYLHATALNHALAAFMPAEFTGIDPEVQSYIIGEHNGGSNIPRYRNSLVAKNFYFTPARMIGPLKFFPEWTKGENDGFANVIRQGETLKAEILNYLPPETEFEGYLISKLKIAPLFLIRLGSFRGKARLQYEEAEIVDVIKDEVTASHPVDPLVTTVFRGVMVNMFPYPLVENATIKHGVSIKLPRSRGTKTVAIPDEWSLPIIEHIKRAKGGIIV
ncbi:MAG: hypothetical protein ABIK22_06125 [candidate division WOR-3 bacterium]